MRLSARRLLPLLAAAIVLADVTVVLSREGRGATMPVSVAVERRLVAESPRVAAQRAERRDEAIDAMFARRAKAVRDRDLAAFLADLDPEQRAFAVRQRQVFASLGKLEFSHWSYERSGDSYSPGNVDFARYGAIADLWLPVLYLRYQLTGFDVAPVGRRVVYTVVHRAGRWWIGGDTDLDATTSSGTSVRVDPWENGPIVVERGRYGIVIGHPEDRAAIGRVRREVDDAARHVTAYTGRKQWNGKVVVVLPTDDDELARVLENPTTFYDFAAVARPLATIPRGGEDERLAGARVVINPEGFDADSEFTTLLIRHEVTHVALFRRTGPLSPKWLVEGVAEYVGNAGSRLPPEVLAAELSEQVDRDGPPTTLPTDSDFGLIDDASIGYNTAWLLCRYIASRWSRAALFRLHDAMGTRAGLDRPGEKYPRALRTVLGTTEESLLDGWRRYVSHTVGDLTGLVADPGGAYVASDRGRLPLDDLARQKDVPASRLRAAGVDRAATAFFYDGAASSPRRRLITTLVVAATEPGAAAVERLFTDRLRRYDASPRAIPHGVVFLVGTRVGSSHYNEAIAVVRTGTVVVEVRVAAPGAGDPRSEAARIAAAQYARLVS